MHNTTLTLALALTLVLTLGACGAPVGALPTAVPAAVPAAVPTATPAPAPESPSAAAQAAAPNLTAQELAELAATAVAGLPPTSTPAGADSFAIGITDVAVLRLQAPPGSPPLAAVYSVGTRDFAADGSQFVAIYERTQGGWAELARAEIANADVLWEGGVAQVAVTPDTIWLAVSSGVGAHGGCFDLLRLDGAALVTAATACHPSPAAADLGDIDGDGVLEVLLNRSDVYLFCYACGVRATDTGALQWDGAAFVERGLDPLPATAPAALREPVNRAIALAQAGLWRDAEVALAPALSEEQTPESRWQIGLLTLLADGRRTQAQSGAYPLLDNLLYGDYAAALVTVRPYSLDEIFDSPSALVVGTTAEGWEAELSAAITRTVELTLAAQPDLAAAHFFQGWALNLVEPGSPAALAAVERAAQLDPDEALYSASVAYLRRP